ncbi:MAG: hypothetical protein WAM26_15315, partial [Nitrososphaeraceae archaeon]
LKKFNSLLLIESQAFPICQYTVVFVQKLSVLNRGRTHFGCAVKLTVAKSIVSLSYIGQISFIS